MVMLNDLDRFHLVIDVIDRVPGLASRAGHVRQLMVDKRIEARAYTRLEGEDAPEIANWAWPTPAGLILVVNAGSSSLQAPAARPGRRRPRDGGPAGDRRVPTPRRRRRRRSPAGRRRRRSGTGSSTAGRGSRRRSSLDDAALAGIDALSPLAPLHQPRSLAAISAVARRAARTCPHVACFDTAFHATLPEAAATYAIPAAWRELGVRRYGFHGLSHAYASRRAASCCAGATATTAFRVVTCHLGAGASLAAVRGGRSVDTTMGFTPLEGLVMATRSGSIDPGLVAVARDGARDVRGRRGRRRAGAPVGPGGARRDRRHARRCWIARPPATGTRSSPSTSTCHRLRASIAAMAASLGGSTPSCSPAASASGPRRSGRSPPRASSSSASRWTTRANEAATGTADADVGAYGARRPGVRRPGARGRRDRAPGARGRPRMTGRVRATFVAFGAILGARAPSRTGARLLARVRPTRRSRSSGPSRSSSSA